MSFLTDLLEVPLLSLSFLIRDFEGRIFFFVRLWLSRHGFVELGVGLGSMRRNDSVFVCFRTKFLNQDLYYALVFLEDCFVLSLLLTYFKITS